MRGLKAVVDAAGGWEPLAARLGVQTATIRRWLRDGAMPLEKADKIRRIYGVRIEANRKDHGGLALLEEAMRAGLDTLTIRRRLGVSDAAFREWKRRGCVPVRHAAVINEWIDALKK